MSNRAAAVLVLIVTLSAAGHTQSPSAQSWPGLSGPARNGESPAPFAATTPVARELWRRPVTGGYSEIAVAGGHAITMELRAGADFVVALDPATGREQWSTRVGGTRQRARWIGRRSDCDAGDRRRGRVCDRTARPSPGARRLDRQGAMAPRSRRRVRRCGAGLRLRRLAAGRAGSGDRADRRPEQPRSARVRQDDGASGVERGAREDAGLLVGGRRADRRRAADRRGRGRPRLRGLAG